ncbi:restriction endonuclease subunit S [[Mycobacterium] burgundiense]|uniref:Restriction endonuclease subunit S n=1 Tax=[Mycobacterium] burgundiense TaxID=3064286 RepID=A0ABM9L7X8_9MYCO|nr:restriction endonuclease subunit S [Mycolicibacterium sp. MU0053]CAJ1494390.1 restriction endonuclease subunit S [Mycolicibacterium sp. MU0053]
MTWPTVSLGDCGEIQGGLQVTSKRDSLPLSRPYLRVANVYRGRLDLTEIKTICATQTEIDRTRLEPGDLLFVEGHGNPEEVGRVAMWNGSVPDCVHQNHLIRVRLDRNVLIPEFAARWFNSPAGASHFRRAGKTTSGLNTISTHTVRSAVTPLPPLDEQRRIAAILDRVDELDLSRRAVDERIDEVPTAIFFEMFGDPAAASARDTEPLGELVTLRGGGTPSKANPANWKGELPWFSPKDLKRKFLFDSIDHVSETVLDSTSLKAIPRDTILIVVRGMILAHTVPISIVKTRCTINQDLKALIPRVEIDPLFLHTALAIQHARILDSVSTAAHGTKRLDVEDLKAVRIPRPTAGAQTEFIERVNQVEDIARAAASQAKTINELFRSLQSRAFSGQL